MGRCPQGSVEENHQASVGKGVGGDPRGGAPSRGARAWMGQEVI